MPVVIVCRVADRHRRGFVITSASSCGLCNGSDHPPCRTFFSPVESFRTGVWAPPPILIGHCALCFCCSTVGLRRIGILASRATCLAGLVDFLCLVAIQDILFSSSTGVGIPATLIVRIDLVRIHARLSLSVRFINNWCGPYS